MIPRPYHGSYSVEKGHEFLQQAWIIALAKSVEIFLFVSIFEMPNIKFWQDLEKNMVKAKEIIPNECRIGDTCFTSLATIGGNLYKRYARNLNHIHKDSKDLLSVIIILGTDVHGGETVFFRWRNFKRHW